MTPSVAEYYENMRLNPYAVLFEPNLEVPIGTRHKNKPGFIKGRSAPVKSKYWAHTIATLRGTATPAAANPTKHASAQPKTKEEEPTMKARPWTLQRQTTTVLQSVGLPTASSDPADKREVALGKARTAIAREARNGATEFALALRTASDKGGGGGGGNAVAGLDLEGFISFIRRRIEGNRRKAAAEEGQHEVEALDEATLRDLRYFFAVLDRNGDGHLSTAEFFALSILESCEAAGYEAGISTLLTLYPELFRQGPVDQVAFKELLLFLGFNHSPESVVSEILKQAMESNWKRLAESSTGKTVVRRATGEDLLAWFRELIRPTTISSRLQQAHRTPSKHNAGGGGAPTPSIRDLIHLLAHGLRVRDRELRAAAKRRAAEGARTSSTQQPSSSSGGADDGMGKLGCILPTAKDKEDAAGIARYIRNEMSDDSVAGLLMKLQEWDQDGDRMLGLKEFYRALTASFEVPEAAAVTASPAAVQVLFDELDSDGTGKVTFKGLEEWFDAGEVRLRLALRRVRVFATLGEPNIIKLQQAMKERLYKEGEWVFSQDEQGETFYVILGGACDVLRTEVGAEEATCLAKLGVGDFFGERSLLRKEVRYAGIVATGSRDLKGLETMCITAEDFERAMGRSLREMVPDEYA